MLRQYVINANNSLHGLPHGALCVELQIDVAPCGPLWRITNVLYFRSMPASSMRMRLCRASSTFTVFELCRFRPASDMSDDASASTTLLLTTFTVSRSRKPSADSLLCMHLRRWRL